MENLPQTTETEDEQSNLEKARNEAQWEENHARIGNVIIDHLHEHGTMPSKTLIAHKAGLSRQAVTRHLKTYNASENHQSERDALSLMTNQVLAQVLNAALHGDLKAAKIYLERADGLNSARAGQNNYIQINKTVINQQIIQQLKPQQLKRIEQIISEATEEEKD